MDSPNSSILTPEPPPEPKGKILNLWSRCIAKPTSLLGSSIFRFLSQIDVKNRIASLTVKRVDLVSKCVKRLPDVSLSCHVSASFSLNSAKNKEEDLEKQERCRKIAKIEHEIRNLERHLARGTRV
ncbi:hypothetical protein GCK72_004497 [Caenorhabditis remanei]|uniref:Uncharacterized protein n=1 Tax=Caenorhabditis remanei TaxID=31234 RepID=A0A6A5H9X4_CAERE|nr:hypothetical protein GCK72_004497 [Caenorhabditis remanei]KAF1764548.1 hypothetical protein GCK72_004497 [Caenorhabditis remanei]